MAHSIHSQVDQVVKGIQSWMVRQNCGIPDRRRVCTREECEKEKRIVQDMYSVEGISRTYIVPVGATHFQPSISWTSGWKDVAIANNVGKAMTA